MIIAKIKGGLGNQMFQYACARALSVKTGINLKFDITSYSKKDTASILNDTPRKFSLDKFNTEIELADEKEIEKINPLRIRLFKKIRNRIIELFVGRFNGYEDRYPVIKDKNKNIFLNGNWQNEKYFKEIGNTIRTEFTLKNQMGQKSQEISNLIENIKKLGRVSISVHIRRTDYISVKINHDFFYTCDIAYYEKGLQIITGKINNKDIEIFVFSDDIAWVKENLKFPYPIHFASDPLIPDYEEMYLMSLCNHNIIANSSFSWWGAWLNRNPNKIVVAPKQWFKNKTAEELDILPEEWIKI
jgi:hypothetical protein